VTAANEGGTWNALPYDEAFDESGCHRPAYAALARRLGWNPLCPPPAVVESLRGRPLGDDHQLLPVPLALADEEYRYEIQRGVAQRARALQMFFADVFLGEGRYLRSGTALTASLLDEILSSVGATLEQLRKWWSGHGREAICFVYGPDLVREPGGRWVVLEDNVGCVGGCADSYYVLEAYKRATGLSPGASFPPDLSRAVRLWLEGLRLAPGDPGVLAMLSDGNALDAYLPARFEEDDRRIQLVQQLGIQVMDDAEFERLCQGPELNSRLKVVVNIGVPSMRTWWLIRDVAFDQLHVPLLNSPGTILLGHKAFLPFVGEMISFYCREDPILQVPPTSLLRDGLLPTDLDNWVVKMATGCQGTGVFILGSQPLHRLDEIRSLIRDSWPARAAVAQRYVEPSRLRIGGPSGRTYLVELRAIAYVLGWQRVFSAEQSIGKLLRSGSRGGLNNTFCDGSYVPVIRESAADRSWVDERTLP